MTWSLLKLIYQNEYFIYLIFITQIPHSTQSSCMGFITLAGKIHHVQWCSPSGNKCLGKCKMQNHVQLSILCMILGLHSGYVCWSLGYSVICRWSYHPTFWSIIRGWCDALKMEIVSPWKSDTNSTITWLVTQEYAIVSVDSLYELKNVFWTKTYLNLFHEPNVYLWH